MVEEAWVEGPVFIAVVVKIKGPFLGTLNFRCRNCYKDPKGTIILTNTHWLD